MYWKYYKNMGWMCCMASFLLGCSTPPEEDIQLPEEDMIEWSGLRTSLNIPDYEGDYELDATVYTDFDAPPTAQIIGDAFSEDGYIRLDEVGEILVLKLEEVEGVEVRGGPVYDFHYLVNFPSIFCELEMDGRAELEEVYEWTGDSPDLYLFYGVTWVRCFGEEAAVEANRWYDDPGVLVGEVNGRFNHSPLENP